MAKGDLFMKHKLTAQELCNFCQQLGVLIHSGMGPLESLHILLEESTTDTDREVLSNLLSSMEKTGSLSQAVTDSGFFSDSMAAYIKTGEQTGCLDEILDSLSEHYEQEQETSEQIRSAVTYPLLMLGMMGIVIVVLLVKVLPIFRQVFQQMGMEMNGFSSRLLNAGNVITRYSAFFLILAVLLIGCILLFLAGVIGGKVRKSAMETVKISFGQKGSLFFALLNVIQLVGWTAIMIYDGALAANQAAGVGNWVWCLVIGALIVLWIVIGITNLGKLNTVAMAALFILTLILCKVIFFGDYTAETVAADGLTFGAAVELAVAMPLSWLPLISDYTREAKQPVKATAVSAIVYGVISCWMYLIGMGAAIYTGESDIAQIMVKAGLGIVGLLIIIFSTVTTTFLDAYSAGISSETLSHKLNGKYIAIAVTVVGALAAIVYPMDNITNFLYLIGSVFAPMIAIQIADFFLLEEDHSEKEIQISNMVLWVIGFILYRILMKIDIPVGNTLPDIAITVVLCLIWGKISKKK